MIDLDDIFGAPPARADRSSGSDQAEHSDVMTAGSGVGAENGHQATFFKSEPETDGAVLIGTPFEGWVRRQDAQGRWGWEDPTVSDEEAWWRELDFEELDV